jgi:ammonia channel protein AmtB
VLLQGFLHQSLANGGWETLDFAGGTVVHMSSGYTALVGSWFLGPRVDKPAKMTPANIPFVMLGTGGWWPRAAGISRDLVLHTRAVHLWVT